MPPIVYHPQYSITWPLDHRFPMSKFRMLRDYLLAREIADPHWFHKPRPVSVGTLRLVHDPAYIEAFQQGSLDEKRKRRIGMHWYPDLVSRTFAEVGGTVLTSRLALKHGLALNTAGGTHHAFPDYGSGYCIFNDIAVAAQLALKQGLVRKILVIDLDVHQGDGTAFIFRDEPRVFTFSVHGARNFPFRKQNSELDKALPNHTGDEAYLALLKETLPNVLAQVQPDLVFYDAGVDVHEHDRLGKLALTDEGLYQRDLYVLRTCRQQGFSVACVIGGGYAEDRNQLAPRHAAMFRAAVVVAAKPVGG